MLEDIEELFRNWSPGNRFTFLMNWKNRYLQTKKLIFWRNLQIKIIVYLKPKWSVWSIRTFSTTRIWAKNRWNKLVMEDNWFSEVCQNRKIWFEIKHSSFWKLFWVRVRGIWTLKETSKNIMTIKMEAAWVCKEAP